MNYCNIQDITNSGCPLYGMHRNEWSNPFYYDFLTFEFQYVSVGQQPSIVTSDISWFLPVFNHNIRCFLEFFYVFL